MNKTISKLLVVLSIILTNTSLADEYRTWTESKSGRTIVAKPIDKKIESNAIQVQTKQGTKHWLQSQNLSAADQKFIKQWVKPVDHLSVRVVGFGKGYKTIEITATSGARPMKVVTKFLATKPAKTHTRTIPAGQVATYKLKVVFNYECKAYAGRKVKKKIKYRELIDQESHDRKTGL